MFATFCKPYCTATRTKLYPSMIKFNVVIKKTIARAVSQGSLGRSLRRTIKITLLKT